MCSIHDAPGWLPLRAALWPEMTAAENRDDIERMFSEPERFIAFLAREGGVPTGFAEAAVRRDYVNGCETSPVLFLEGIYVVPQHRRKGIARALNDAVAQWGRSKGCSEFASDALIENNDSHKMHEALGFTETERVVYFRKLL